MNNTLPGVTSKHALWVRFRVNIPKCRRPNGAFTYPVSALRCEFLLLTLIEQNQCNVMRKMHAETGCVNVP